MSILRLSESILMQILALKLDTKKMNSRMRYNSCYFHIYV